MFFAEADFEFVAADFEPVNAGFEFVSAGFVAMVLAAAAFARGAFDAVGFTTTGLATALATAAFAAETFAADFALAATLGAGFDAVLTGDFFDCFTGAFVFEGFFTDFFATETPLSFRRSALPGARRRGACPARCPEHGKYILRLNLCQFGALRLFTPIFRAAGGNTPRRFVG
jgi:hypothetical protein